MRRVYLLPLVALLALSGCDEEPEPNEPRYRATLRYTQYGIVHVSADSLGGASFGQGYAMAREHACTLADQIVKVRGMRALYYGPGPGDRHVASDFAYRVLDLPGRVRGSLERQPAEVQEVLNGFVAGYNRYLLEPEAGELPCAGQPWLSPLSAEDLLAYHRSIAMLLGSRRLLSAIAAAQPPSTSGGWWQPREAELPELVPASFGSNGWALGSQRAASGRGMLMANPHLPWEGELRLWESHLVVPGQIDVYGASLLGVPGAIIGFNANVAWTQTAATSGSRFTAYSLKLVPGKPTSYLYDGQERAMTARSITLQVRQPDGSLQDVTRTYYSSHHGPIISLAGVGWSNSLAIAYRDANLDNEGLLTQYLGMARASSLEQFQQVFSSVQGSSWVHTMAADREGHVWYVDGSATPNLSPATLQAWQQALASPSSPQSALLRSGVVLLDGSTARDEWVEESGARGPGLVPFTSAPKLSRRDFVFNANGSHWLTNPSAPLEGFSPLYGPERTSRTPRTRMNALLLTEARAGGASGPEGLFTLEELQAAMLDNRSLTAELLREAVVQRCQASPQGTAGGQGVDLTQACAVLAAWNGRFDSEQAGPTLWREFIHGFSTSALSSAGPLFAVPFSPSNPVATPHSLASAPASGPDPVLNQLAAAVLTLRRAGVPLDRPLGEVQFALRGGQRVPVHGGQDADGVTNIVNYEYDFNTSLVEPSTLPGTVISSRTVLTTEGYPINFGSSFIMALEFTDRGVRARALLPYGQTSNTSSPAYRDQLLPFSNKQWRTIAHTEQELAADPTLTTLAVQSD